MSDWIRESLRSRDERRRAMRERFFPTPEPAESATHPEGDADGGKGEGPDMEMEHVDTDAGREVMQVFDINNLDDEKEN